MAKNTKPSAVKKVAAKKAAAKPPKGKPAAAKPSAKPAPKNAPAKPAVAKAKPAAPKAAPTAPAKPAAAAKPAAVPAKAAPGAKAAAPASKLSNTVPGKPGSLLTPPMPPRSRLSVREPAEADDLKAKIGALATAINQIRAVKRSIQRTFWDVGLILVDIRDRKLYVAKGYGSFEAFLEREIELGKTTSLRLARAVQIFVREPAVAAGMDRVLGAVAAFDGETEPAAITTTAPVPARPTVPTSAGLTRSPIPFHKQ